jgi:predicted nuclease with TOPRIM domain
VLFVSARFDGVVPERCRESLWEALGRPERIDVPFGHYTTILALEWIVSRAANFAVARLDGTDASAVQVAAGR